ncbi:hypothetical protein COLO4_18751 [Corchorus olitorius]|uniref:Uncharacterized protein n=1 Tax=Corchorus olitorius TaxID=93759 RepID=A0A1R3J805_9ROSI|nr:hypothetical protein COLO4_18751 [Corchorus olitorius]
MATNNTTAATTQPALLTINATTQLPIKLNSNNEKV